MLFGASSMLGWSILQARPGTVAFCNGNTKTLPAGVERRIDLCDDGAVAAVFARESPALIIHCAGVCDVEDCERSPEFAYAVNVEATRILVARAPASARIVYCSSDHVFGAGGTGPYAEDAAVAPISVYGQTRVAAEQIVLARANTLVLRSGLWIGPSSNGRIGHLDWLRDRHRRGLPMTVVTDEIRSAVWAEHAAHRVWELADSALTGIRHITAARAVARPELAAFLIAHHAIGAEFAVQPRSERKAPHLGNVELATSYSGALAAALPEVVTRAATDATFATSAHDGKQY
jgi:dTDP-4-dehydrorhamnose reductase